MAFEQLFATRQHERTDRSDTNCSDSVAPSPCFAPTRPPARTGKRTSASCKNSNACNAPAATLQVILPAFRPTRDHGMHLVATRPGRRSRPGTGGRGVGWDASGDINSGATWHDRAGDQQTRRSTCASSPSSGAFATGSTAAGRQGARPRREHVGRAPQPCVAKQVTRPIKNREAPRRIQA